MIMALDLCEHSEYKLKEGKISISEVEDILKEPENIYLDIETGNLVAGVSESPGEVIGS
jgi:hypothetical protein